MWPTPIIRFDVIIVTHRVITALISLFATFEARIVIIIIDRPGSRGVIAK